MNEAIQYYLYSPSKYSAAFLLGMLNPGRYQKNKELYQSVSESKGQVQFGTADSWEKGNEYVDRQTFEANEVLDAYFRKIIELCEEYQIQFVFQNPPMNRATYDNLQQSFVEDYESYLKSLQEDYPNAVIDTELFEYDNKYFGDGWHLNKRGTVYFSKQMRKKYSYIFTAKGKV